MRGALVAAAAALLLPSRALAFLLPSHGPASAPAASSLGVRQPRPTTTVRHFEVGGGDAPSSLTLQEAFNTATAIGSMIVGGIVFLEVYQERPRGWVNEQLVEAAPSTLGPQAGRGLFALVDIPKGTVIGSYPGSIIPKSAWVSRKTGEEAVVLASRYAWTLADGTSVIDPTLPNGELPETLVALGGLIRKPTLLALVNEPPVGVDVNLVPVITDTSVEFVAAERDIFAGEELWIDCESSSSSCLLPALHGLGGVE